MDQKDCHAIIEQMLNNDLKSRVLLGHTLKDFQCAYGSVLDHIRALEADKEPEIPETEVDKVQRTIITLTEKVLYKALDRPFAEFVLAWTTLMNNWNKNTTNNPHLERNIDICQRFIQNFVTMNETMNVLKHLGTRLQQFEGWQPPAFKVAGHYLDYLKDK